MIDNRWLMSDAGFWILFPHPVSRIPYPATVTALDENNKKHSFTIVGEDEVAIHEGKISWVSPFASMVMGKKIGDTVAPMATRSPSSRLVLTTIALRRRAW